MHRTVATLRYFGAAVTVFTTSFWQHVRGRRFYWCYRCCNYVQSWQYCTRYGISEFYQKETKYGLCSVSVNIYRLKSIIERMRNQFKGVMLLLSYVAIKAFFTHNYLTFTFLLHIVISYQWAHFFSWKCFIIYSKLTIIVTVYYTLFIMLYLLCLLRIRLNLSYILQQKRVL